MKLGFPYLCGFVLCTMALFALWLPLVLLHVQWLSLGVLGSMYDYTFLAKQFADGSNSLFPDCLWTFGYPLQKSRNCPMANLLQMAMGSFGTMFHDYVIFIQVRRIILGSSASLSDAGFRVQDLVMFGILATPCCMISSTSQVLLA